MEENNGQLKMKIPQELPKKCILQRMFSIFFNSKGIVHSFYRKLNHASNAIYYRQQIRKITRKLKGQKSKIIIHDDNAPIHKAKLMNAYYGNTGIKRMTHPRYSPDLAPNDFWLIRKLKRAMDDKYITSDRKLYMEVIKILKNIPAHEYARRFDKWLVRRRKCIEKQGEYFEYHTRNIKREINNF